MPSVNRNARLALLASLLAAGACAPSTDGVLVPDPLLHLADRLDVATVATAGAPMAARERMRWDFAEEAGPWRSARASDPSRVADVELEPTGEALRLTLRSSVQQQGAFLVGGVATALENLRFQDWESVLVEARTNDPFFGITAGYNLGQRRSFDQMTFFFSFEEAPPLFNDGSSQVYALPLVVHEGEEAPETLDSIGVFVAGRADESLEILSITLVPRGAAYLEDSGARSVDLGGTSRHALFAHTPVEMSYRVRIPDSGRLDVGFGAISGQTVRYSIAARDGDQEEVLAEAEVDRPEWNQRSADLSAYSGRDVDVVLRADSEQEGAVALWGAPILSGAVPSERPNVIFYVIDGGGADDMSAFGYNRRTTPFLERLAQQGAVFEHAYSNATWTQPSTASFMTSLQHSVLGGLRRGSHSTPVPSNAPTMAERMRAGGYATVAFTANPNAGRVIGLQRGVDVMRDVEDGHHSQSSRELHERLWSFLDDYPVSPYWVHFQTTDVHEPNEPEAPYKGLWVTNTEREQIAEWEPQLFQVAGDLFGTTSIVDFYDQALARAKIDRHSYYEVRRGLYDETMAFQDAQLERLVAHLKANGTWENTLLVIGADHGHPAGTFARWGRGLIEPQPEPWQGALFDSFATHVPLMVVWPGHIAGGQRFAQPVSMIDVLPTILDLVGLPAPEVAQGHSLAPLLRGEPYEPHPVILDEFRVDTHGNVIGNLDIVDGRWGASLEIGPDAEADARATGRTEVPAGGRWATVHRHFPDAPRLLLYDLWNDPFAAHAVNEEHPDLVEHYREMLMTQWQAHRALAQRFSSDEEVALAPEQLQQLRALGYIR